MTTRETRELTATETKLIELLTTSTGSAMMDSGGTPQYNKEGEYTGSIHGYGRAHERNQGRTFVDEPATSLHFSSWYVDKTGKEGPTTERGGDIEFSVSVFHFLERYLEYDEQLDDFYNWYIDEVKEEQDDPYPQDVEDFIQWMRDAGFEIGGLHGDNEEAWSGNTYNGDCNLTQTLQYWLLSVNEVPEEYEERLPCPSFYMLLLQIHQGADVRGGYTAPVVFTANRHYEMDSFFSFNDGTIYCNGCGAHWQTDDGHYWCEDGSPGGDKILDWPAHKEASALLTVAIDEEARLTDLLACRMGARSMAIWFAQKGKYPHYSLEYRACFDVLEAWRRGDPDLASMLWRNSGIPRYVLSYDKPAKLLRSLIWSGAQVIAGPQAALLTASARKIVNDALGAVAKRPYVQLDECTFVTLDDIEEHDDLNQSLSEYMGNPSIPEPVPDGQATYLDDDSDIRDSRNHPRNKQDTKGWAVTHGYVLIDENHNGHCPFCGYVLEGGF